MIQRLARYLYWDLDQDRAKQVEEMVKFHQTLSPDNQSADKVLLEIGKSFLKLGRPADAIHYFDQVTNLPLEKCYFHALSFFAMGHYADASNVIDSLGTPISLEQFPPELILLKARLDYFKGELKVAASQLESLVKLPGSVSLEAQALLSMVCFDSNDIDAALQWSEIVLTQQPHNHDALLARASSAAYKMDADSAMQLAMQGTSSFENSGRFWLILSQAQLLSKDLGNAYTSVCKACSLMASHIGSWHIKGWLEITNNELGLAKSSFEKAMSLNRNFADSHAALAVIALNCGEQEQATRLAKTALKLDPNSVTAKYANGLISAQASNQTDEHVAKLETVFWLAHLI